MMRSLRSTGREFRRVGCVALMAGCVYNFATTSYNECLLDLDCTDPEQLSALTLLFSQSLCITCFVSFAVVSVGYRGMVVAYGRRIGLHETYASTALTERRQRIALDTAVVLACIAIIVPVNALRLVKLHEDGRELGLLAYFVVMYSQNMAMCMLETRFFAMCHNLYQKFRHLNRDMERIGDEIGYDHGRSYVRQAEPRTLGFVRETCWIVGDDGLYRSQTTGQRLADVVERLRIRHRLLREAADELKHVFAVPMGMSLCNLGVMALFDVYYHMINGNVQQQTNIRSMLFICLWITQYMFRFFLIVKTANATSKQVGKFSVSY